MPTTPDTEPNRQQESRDAISDTLLLNLQANKHTNDNHNNQCLEPCLAYNQSTTTPVNSFTLYPKLSSTDVSTLLNNTAQLNTMTPVSMETYSRQTGSQLAQIHGQH